MSNTTTLKLPDDLKARITAAAEHAGQSPHAFMIEALRLQTGLAEMRRRFTEGAHAAREDASRASAREPSGNALGLPPARQTGEALWRSTTKRHRDTEQEESPCPNASPTACLQTAV